MIGGRGRVLAARLHVLAPVWFNLTGQPAVMLPLGDAEGGFPVAVQLTARYGDEATLFRLGGQLERARPWFDRKPPLVS